jgi:type IV pilus assembly protein PilN
MATINLLPWRDQYRQDKKKEYLGVLGGVFLLALIAGFLWVSSVEGDISSQQNRNAMLTAEIKVLSERVKEIKELKKRREELISRMKVIQDLQGTRPIIVRHFDELVRSVPDGVHLESLSRKGTTISIKGLAESNMRVSSFMRNLDESDWFAAPNLKGVSASQTDDSYNNSFELIVKTSAPKDKKKGE